MKKVFCLIVALTLVMAWGVANAQSIVGTAHDLSSSTGNANAAADIDRICDFCHFPHNADLTMAAVPLWNHTSSAGAIANWYASPTYQGGTPAALGDISLACMSCHDGTIAVESLQNNPRVGTPNVTGTNIAVTGELTGGALLDTDLRNDHPISFAPADSIAAGDTEINTPTDGTPAFITDGTNTVYLSGTTGATATMECSSCHDPHDNSIQPFLVMSNAASALCLTCHIK